MKMESETTSFRLPSDAFTFGTDLYSLSLEAVEKESLLPLLKDELRCKIQNKRLSQGMEELKIDFKMKPPAPLTAEEIQKQENRKLLNRESAKKCRRKKKTVYQNVQQMKPEDSENLTKIPKIEDQTSLTITEIENITLNNNSITANTKEGCNKELKSLIDENRHLKERICCIETEKEFFLSNILRHPVISEVLSDFSKSFDNNLTEIKNEIIYVQN